VDQGHCSLQVFFITSCCVKFTQLRRSNCKKKSQLGMPIGTASARLKKSIMFSMAQRLGLDFCFQCSARIEKVEEFSVEHKVPYLDSENPVDLFFDLDNIAFSHLNCNVGASRPGQPPAGHGTERKYKNGCRCDDCRAMKSKKGKEYYWSKKKHQKASGRQSPHGLK